MHVEYFNTDTFKIPFKIWGVLPFNQRSGLFILKLSSEFSSRKLLKCLINFAAFRYLDPMSEVFQGERERESETRLELRISGSSDRRVDCARILTSSNPRRSKLPTFNIGIRGRSTPHNSKFNEFHLLAAQRNLYVNKTPRHKSHKRLVKVTLDLPS